MSAWTQIANDIGTGATTLAQAKANAEAEAQQLFDAAQRRATDVVVAGASAVGRELAPDPSVWVPVAAEVMAQTVDWDKVMLVGGAIVVVTVVGSVAVVSLLRGRK